jgi:hypothetical protein
MHVGSLLSGLKATARALMTMVPFPDTLLTRAIAFCAISSKASRAVRIIDCFDGL